MVAASKKLLDHVRKQALREEILVMRLRGRLIVLPPAKRAGND